MLGCNTSDTMNRKSQRTRLSNRRSNFSELDSHQNAGRTTRDIRQYYRSNLPGGRPPNQSVNVQSTSSSQGDNAGYVRDIDHMGSNVTSDAPTSQPFAQGIGAVTIHANDGVDATEVDSDSSTVMSPEMFDGDAASHQARTTATSRMGIITITSDDSDVGDEVDPALSDVLSNISLQPGGTTNSNSVNEVQASVTRHLSFDGTPRLSSTAGTSYVVTGVSARVISGSDAAATAVGVGAAILAASSPRVGRRSSNVNSPGRSGTVSDSSPDADNMATLATDRVTGYSDVGATAPALMGNEDTEDGYESDQTDETEQLEISDGETEEMEVDSMESERQNGRVDLDESTSDFQVARVISAPVSASVSAPGSAAVSALVSGARYKSPEKKSDDESGDEGCSICFEMWTTSGKHRIVSLKCGHLFGYSCIQKWLKGQGQKCPQCNVPAKVSDIRVIYARTLKAVDTTEVNRLRLDLEQERELRRKLEMEAAELRLKHRLSADQCKKQQEMIDTYKQQITSLRESGTGVEYACISGGDPRTADTSVRRSDRSYLLEKTVVISEMGGCRVSACSVRLGLLVVSQPSPNQLFPGYGIKKLSCMDWRTAQYVSIHSKPIRDLAFHELAPANLLSAAMDKTLKLTSLNSNAVIMSFSTPAPVWSCTWAQSCHHAVAGLCTGQTMVYDTRRPDTPLHELNTSSRSPVVSLQYVPHDVQASFRPGGLLVGQLDRCSFHQLRTDAEPRVHLLPLEGSMSCMSFERRSRHLLASFRPSVNFNTTRHLLCEMVSTSVSADPTNLDVLCLTNCVQTFHGGARMSQLSRSTLFEHPDKPGQLLVSAGDEASLSVKIWNGSEGRPLQRLRTEFPVLDTGNFNFNNQNYLTTLTEKALSIYKWS